jgi:response regulator RpfG family c-di-GMP phosphodiesterase
MPTPLRILFVDDERQVLDGLRNLLRRDRTRWDMSFATSGLAALEAFAERPFDLVISDMRMPGLDGPALLERIKIEHPATVRVILSGQADRDAVLRAVPAAQQFLGKPCGEATLRRTIERIERLSRLVVEAGVRSSIGSLHTLPTPAAVHLRLREALASQSRQRVAEVVREDPALALKVLQLANWECFGPRRIACRIEDAVDTLGLELIAGLLGTAEGPSQAEDPERISRLQRCASASARLAQRLVADPERGADAFTAGLLHDVALLALAAGRPNDGAPAPAPDELANVGAYLLTLWGLPEAVVDAVINHRVPARTGRLEFDILGAVHVAVALTNEGLTRAGQGTTAITLDLAYVTALGLSARLPEWRALGEIEVQSCLEAA